MDDNAAQTSAAENPYLSIAVPQMQAAFDSMYSAVRYLVEGKNASLNQIDKWLKKWQDKLEWLVDKYKELLKKFDTLSGDLQLALTLDMAKEAWELIQEFPILRRYLGEANYWLLYDTVGIVATQGASLATDMADAVKSAIKSAIKGLLAMTDGLMSIESYLATISQYWGALYTKTISLPLLDSIVPNVTCTYFYKHPTATPGDPDIANLAPRQSRFLPIPVPIPDPDYVAGHFGQSLAIDMQNPKTWADPATGEPKLLNIGAMQDALEYWGSSYTNETIPGICSADPSVPAVYSRRDYTQDGEKGEHPLQVGRTFAQLDTSKTVVAYGGDDDAGLKDLMVFESLWRDDNFRALLQAWEATWKSARDVIVQCVKGAVRAPKLDSDGNVVLADGQVVYDEFTSMRQIRPGTGDARETAYSQFIDALFSAAHQPDGSPDYKQAAYDAVKSVQLRTHDLVGAYLRGTGQATEMPGLSQYRLSKCAEMSTMLARAALAMRKLTPRRSSYFSATSATPLFGWSILGTDGKLDCDAGLNPFMRVLPNSQIPSEPSDAGLEPPEGWPGGLHEYRLGSDFWRTDTASTWVTTPVWDISDPAATWNTFMVSLIYPALRHPMPESYYKFDDGNVIRYTADPTSTTELLGTVEEGALSNPYAWDCTTVAASNAAYPTCGFFVNEKVDSAPTTVIGALIGMMEARSQAAGSLEEEIADEVGYSILKGRRPLAACFDVYGKLIRMAGWCFKAMPAASLPPTSPFYDPNMADEEQFADKYARIPGSDLWYDKEHPETVVYKHSTFFSSAVGYAYTIYHEAMARTTYKRGSEQYVFYVFPTESVSVQEIRSGTVGELRSIDAEGPDGRKWHYTVMKNAVPKCPKYVEADRWSIADILHELYLLAWGMSPFCCDNGERLHKLESVLKDFGISPPEFIGQLPDDGEDVAANFRITVFDDYAKKIKDLVDSVYTLREEILVVTEAW